MYLKDIIHKADLNLNVKSATKVQKKSDIRKLKSGNLENFLNMAILQVQGTDIHYIP